MAGLTKEQQRKKMEAELAVAIAAKPPTLTKPQAEYNPDYVPPPVVNLQEQFEAARRGPRRSTEDIEASRVIANQDTVEVLKATMADEIHKGLPGATAEAEEASRAETVRQIKVRLAHDETRPDIEAIRRRDEKAHLDNMDLIKAEIARTIHNEAYSG